MCMYVCVSDHTTSSADELTQHASSEHAQLQQSAQIAMETLLQEKHDLQIQLQSQVSLGSKMALLLKC